MLGTTGHAKYSTFDAVPTGPRRHPMDEASSISKFFFSWAEPIMAVGNQRQLSPDDMWELQAANKVAPLTAAFSKRYAANHQGILTTFFSIYWAQFIWLGVLQVFTAVCDLYGPGFVLGEVIDALEAPVFDTTYVLQLIGSLYALSVVSSFAKVHLAFMNDIVGIQFSASLRAMLFEKSLKLSAKSKKEKTAGDIANLFSTDVINIMDFALNAHQMWIVPLQVVIVLYLLFKVVGWASVVGLAVVVVIITINANSAILLGKEEETLFERKDNRMKVLNEVFGAIQIVKFNAWEEKFRDKVQALRDHEVASLWRFYEYVIVLVTLMNCTPVLVTLSVFSTFTLWMKQVLTVTAVFSTVALFKSLQDAMANLPFSIMSLVQSLVSAKRINDVLVMEEVDPANVLTPTDPIAQSYAQDQVVVAIENGSFGWDHANPLFKKVDLRVRRGDFVIVHGAVGQGKSSLCSILLGEMEKYAGHVFVGGSVAYFSQQAWIQNTTIRENILFGKPYDRTKYNKIVEACALTNDMSSFPAGDRTEIGQKGLNLSGGQKARVALARACYSDADIFILDSPLSAVDAIVASEIFRKCFLGLLKNKTIVLVTHNPEIIDSADVDRVYLVQDGQVLASSPKTTKEKTTLSPSVSPLAGRAPYWEDAPDVPDFEPAPREFDTLLTPSHRTPYNFNRLEMLFTPRGATHQKEDASSDGRLVQDEERAEGRVSMQVVRNYIRAVGGWPALVVMVGSTLFMQVFKISSDLWLTQWSNSGLTLTPDAFAASTNYNMAVYGGLSFVSFVFTALQCGTVFAYGVRGAQRLFKSMLINLLQAPMRFFDTNPIGRILNRFGDDIATADLGIPFSIGPMLFELSSALLTLGTTMVLTQWLGLLVIPLLVVYYRLGAYFLEPLREVNRIQKITRSPLISLVSEGIDGSVTIRAYGDKQLRRFYRLHDQKLEVFCSARFANSSVNQWFTLRIQLISSTIVGLILLSVVFLHNSLSPGIVGLLITYGLSIPSNLAFLVNIWARMETSMISPERLDEYIHIQREGVRDGAPAQAWPSAGQVVFDNVSFRYKENDPLVLKNVNFNVRGGEKIGIVGRTGAGKSSLMMALFRMNEVATGSIKIDGVNIASIGLKALRSSLAIIPQNPVLFKGTLRNYLDPFDEYTDSQLWDALHKVKLTERLASVEEKLLGPVEENGENFSVGERQMLCMARALLRQAKIVVLDEATAAIDHETDQNLQRVIRTEFATSTVLTIAHRLDTVLDCDRIMVFNFGELAQCDTPKALVSQGDGIFFELVTEGGYMDKMTIAE
ncbi:Aste57867_11998 [Aphanomyces stellatus]|uniref:Aste57867_11998 protein n=1 Tax=Aphanomyces stellatus TaxID=120398 RepID=A0A485KV11_9STRA|nr:hypothetical protein As57867_011953 [Aphanomyces stellatus]VFT88853.1 Aste57867_11998 [Aphanomyces stellatus]